MSRRTLALAAAAALAALGAAVLAALALRPDGGPGGPAGGDAPGAAGAPPATGGPDHVLDDTEHGATHATASRPPSCGTSSSPRSRPTTSPA